MKLTNVQMDNYLQAMQEISEKVTGKFAYAVARNMRKISEELVEYQNLKNKAIFKYGETDEMGRASIKIGSDAFEKYVEEMKEYSDITHDVTIQTITKEELLSSPLNANEILTIDFMVDEEGGKNNE